MNPEKSISRRVHDDSYAAYIASLEPCPSCGCVDEMDNIEGKPGLLCAACWLDERDDDAGEDDWDESP